MKKVYICSPYRPTGQDPEAERKRNVEKAQTACRLAIDAGYLPLAPHVHDELIIEADPRVSLEAICEQMGRTPPWTPGLVLRADGFTSDFYMKD